VAGRIATWQEAMDYTRNARLDEVAARVLGEARRVVAEERADRPERRGCCETCGFPLDGPGGWMVVNATVGHPLFAALVPCPTCRGGQ
jgi:hypothetical protein